MKCVFHVAFYAFNNHEVQLNVKFSTGARPLKC